MREGRRGGTQGWEEERRSMTATHGIPCPTPHIALKRLPLHHPSLTPPFPPLLRCVSTYMMMVALLHVVDGRAGCRRVHTAGCGKVLGGREQVQEPKALGYYASAHGCLCCG